MQPEMPMEGAEPQVEPQAEGGGMGLLQMLGSAQDEASLDAALTQAAQNPQTQMAMLQLANMMVTKVRESRPQMPNAPAAAPGEEMGIGDDLEAGRRASVQRMMGGQQ